MRGAYIDAMRQPSTLRLLAFALIVGVPGGALYAGLRYQAPFIGAAVGLVMSASFYSVERFVLRRNAGGLIRPLPFLAYFALRSVLYVGVIVFSLFIVNQAISGSGLASITGFDVVFSLVSTVGFTLLISVNDLLGPGVLFAFAAGRYHTPRIEERALLFIDMRASTAIAERLGELSYPRLPQPLRRRCLARYRGRRRRHPQICRRRGHRDMAPFARRRQCPAASRGVRGARPDRGARLLL